MGRWEMRVKATSGLDLPSTAGSRDDRSNPLRGSGDVFHYGLDSVISQDALGQSHHSPYHVTRANATNLTVADIRGYNRSGNTMNADLVSESEDRQDWERTGLLSPSLDQISYFMTRA
ncbi:hypothetical protein NPX13_g5545 [Xylaria arbuscula]|uniref:Uncharacterized protein n=1 Tax=Xylaria arbuscula TaxID=114810 RepID=A0A9W8NDH0_9PEZI|nr:hypothetical protein NPX13_g5545 [Xylaria arbuscula]